ncbi:MAG: hypothetical protein ACI9QC_000134 [Oceanicoccus sp.]|jgi:hypothetical protein
MNIELDDCEGGIVLSEVEAIIARLQALSHEDRLALDSDGGVKLAIADLQSMISQSLNKEEVNLFGYEPPIPVDPEWPIEVTSIEDALLLAQVCLFDYNSCIAGSTSLLVCVLAIYIFKYPNHITGKEGASMITECVARDVTVAAYNVSFFRLKDATGSTFFTDKKQSLNTAVIPARVKAMCESRNVRTQQLISLIFKMYSSRDLSERLESFFEKLAQFKKTASMSQADATKISNAFPSEIFEMKMLENEQRMFVLGVKAKTIINALR